MANMNRTNPDKPGHVHGVHPDGHGHNTRKCPVSGHLSGCSDQLTITEELELIETELLFEVDADRQMRLALAIQSRRLQLEAEASHAA
jgi:hypothetical protein